MRRGGSPNCQGGSATRLFKTLIPTDYDSLIDLIVDEGIGIAETAGREPEPCLEREIENINDRD